MPRNCSDHPCWGRWKILADARLECTPLGRCWSALIFAIPLALADFCLLWTSHWNASKPRRNGRAYRALLCCATVSWRFVELPFRQRQVLPSRGGLFAAAGAASFGLAICALSFVFLSNRPSNPGSESERLADFMDYDDEASYRRGTCFLMGDKQSSSNLKISECLTTSKYRSNVLLVGDSHAAHLGRA